MIPGRLAALAGAVALLVAHPAVARACPVCFDPRESNQSAFLSMTIFMSLLPLGMFGGLVLWIRHRARLSARGDDAADCQSRQSLG